MSSTIFQVAAGLAVSALFILGITLFPLSRARGLTKALAITISLGVFAAVLIAVIRLVS